MPALPPDQGRHDALGQSFGLARSWAAGYPGLARQPERRLFGEHDEAHEV